MLGNSQYISFPSEIAELRLILGGVASFNVRDFVATFQFFDRAGEQLSQSDLDASYSTKFGSYFRYLLSSDVGVGNDIVQPVRLRRPARSVRIEIHPWKRQSRSELTAVQNQLFAVAKDYDSRFIWTRRVGAK